jgi:putative endonuclease
MNPGHNDDDSDERTKNPYWSPSADPHPGNAVEIDTTQAPSSDADACVLSNVHYKPPHASKAIVIILAFARQQPFYIDVADDIHGVHHIKRKIYEDQQALRGETAITPMFCVYLEYHTSKESAHARCEQIKTLPHAWQRRLVDTFNDQWLNVEDELIGFPFKGARCVGEKGIVKIAEPMRANLSEKE